MSLLRTFQHIFSYHGQDGLERKRSILFRLHVDGPLLVILLLLSGYGFLVLFSASGQSMRMVEHQTLRLGLALFVMFIFAQIPPRYYRSWALWLYLIGIVLLLAVLVVGEIGKGAQRWLSLGFFQFQPSEVMKIAVPLMVAAFLSEQQLPPRWSVLLVCAVIIAVPFFLIAKQPDLGTSLLIGASGFFVLLLARMSWRLIFGLGVLGAAAMPVLWHVLHDYQKQRVLTFLNPERDPLGSGYHIIQSKIAIGSGGIFGTGYLQGTQANLEFLPERTTDFIFAVLGEQLGLVGILVLMLLYFAVILRGLYIATQAQDEFSRLVSGGLTLTFFVYVFVNIGMVSGLLPVVGVPLPMVSYGGTSIVTLMAAFGILMSIHTHRNLLVQR